MRTEYRKYIPIKGMEVSRDGKRVWRDYLSGNPINTNGHFLKIKTDKTGNRYVLTKDYGRIRVDEMVATCFCSKNSGENFVIHKDKDNKNCSADNLEWATWEDYISYNFNRQTDEWLPCYAYDCWVSREGKIKDDKEKVLPVRHFGYDPDTKQCYIIEPSVTVSVLNGYGGRSDCTFSVENQMRAFLPIPKGLQSPALLHLDKDWLNFSVDNLKWVEEDSKEYQDYLEQKKADQDKESKELND